MAAEMFVSAMTKATGLSEISSDERDFLFETLAKYTLDAAIIFEKHIKLIPPIIQHNPKYKPETPITGC